MLGCVENGDEELALELFDRMQMQEGLLNARTLVPALMACASLAVTHKWRKEACLERGAALHSLAVQLGFVSDVYVGSTLVDMYASCGRLDRAREVFEKMRQRDAVSWTTMIQGCIDNEEGEMALQLFRRMSSCEDGVLPDGSTYVAVLTACAGLAAREVGFQCSYEDPGKLVKLQSLQKGMEIHRQALKSGYSSDFFVASSLVVMYAKCGSMADARAIFDRLPHYDAVCWTALILGYAESDEAELALELFWCMQRELGCLPSSRTFVTALVACTGLAAKDQAQQIDGKLVKVSCLDKGMAIHCEAATFGWDCDVFVASSLVDVYGKCGSVLDARLTFDRMPRHDTVLWTAMIQACGENGEDEAAVELFHCMATRGLLPNARTSVAVLSSIASLAARKEEDCRGAAQALQVDRKIVGMDYLERVMSIHSRCRDVDFIMENTLIDAYSKCGSVMDARKVFDRMESHDVVSWNALILGLVDNGEAELATELFARMTQNESSPAAADTRTFAAVLTACSSLAALETGKLVHARVCRLGVECEPYVSNCLVGLYSRCGSISDAEELFGSISDRKNAVAWSALLAGYSSQGTCEKVFSLLEGMRKEGLQADGVALLGVLSVCSHAGLVEKGKDYFAAMLPKYGAVPELKHYHCMIDMLGRANLVSEAVAMVEAMPYRATAMTWTIVLAACHKWNNHAAGNAAFQALVKLEPENASAYLMMANIYTQPPGS
ncbi:pentatricopeptide repeat-containing protein At1g11290, chloroplastic-like [Selaginella moellendorffii]|uniref:pentatricopeptide repeat-containing protein At1g11290, chloroplastic-like n=1 Tax=Selaginella moellendorffii TaxID=88036 RepID=UPI000D1C3551|nr:pentatricopeptide repeat-containing protein At1g11290, chloroplastic-like [Selaginella moellendorffii]|eukprot:XP_024515653.1 pentatricopeptide repeat-containing protein At1g11290, chloroplastic-like [Selaginella moellendorffii]